MEAPSQAGQQSVDKQDDGRDAFEAVAVSQAKLIDSQQAMIDRQKEAMLLQSREIIQLREQFVEHGYIPKLRL